MMQLQFIFEQTGKKFIKLLEFRIFWATFPCRKATIDLENTVFQIWFVVVIKSSNAEVNFFFVVDDSGTFQSVADLFNILWFIEDHADR